MGVLKLTRSFISPEMRRWLSWLWSVRSRLWAGTLALVVSSLLAAFTPRLLGQVIAALPGVALGPAGVLAGVFAAQVTGAALGVYGLGRGVARVVADLRARLFGQSLRANAAFHDQHWSAELATAVTHDAALVEQSLGTLLPILAQSLPLTIIGAGGLLWTDARLTMGLLLAGLPLGGAVLVIGRALRRAARAGQAALGEVGRQAQEGLAGLWLIKTLTREADFEARFAEALAEHTRARQGRAAWQGALEVALPAGAGLVVLVGAGLIRQTPPSVESLATFSAALAVLAAGAYGLLRGYTFLQAAVGATTRLLALEAALASAAEPRAGRPLAGRPRTLRLESVSFTYPEGTGGVSDLSLTLAAGERVALVGPNGAGKSTLIRLLQRLYTPQQGELYLDDQPAAAIELGAWRRQFAVVTRDPVVFALSVADNIALGRPGATPAEIEAAARQVGLHDLVRALPGGYAAQVGEGGARLSAGQRQRLALARLCLQDPAVLILDEATNSLDADGLAAVTALIATWARERLVLLVAPEVAEGWAATRRVTLRRGRIVQDRAFS